MTWQIDPIHSKVEFGGRHMMVARVRGHFAKYALEAKIDENNLAGSSATLRVDVASLDSGFGQRDDHLRSADFFDVEKYPELVFKTTSIERKKGDDYRISGDLTIRDVTRQVTFEAEVNGPIEVFGAQKIGISAQAKINRKDWGLEWNMPLGIDGLLVSDEITLSFDAELAKVA